MTVGELSAFLSSEISLSLQESYDNSGLQLGDNEQTIDSVLLTVDVTEAIVDEAIQTGSGMIISHHPLIFEGLRKIENTGFVERIVRKAIKNDIAIYSAHTNLDVIEGGVSYKMAEKIGLINVKTLAELGGKLLKLVVFVPTDSLEKVKSSMYEAGAGNFGSYDHCSFNIEGEGNFRPREGSKPYSGKLNLDNKEMEIRVEMIIPEHLKSTVVSEMIKAHPYEEVAYDLYRLENKLPNTGLGCYGELAEKISGSDFLKKLEDIFDASGIRYSGSIDSEIKRVALCGGSGSSLLKDALKVKADIFVTGDVKYHSFFEGDSRMIIADIGHYESEKFSVEILYDIITKKFPKFAVRFSKNNTNPINYLRAWKK